MWAIKATGSSRLNTESLHKKNQLGLFPCMVRQALPGKIRSQLPWMRRVLVPAHHGQQCRDSTAEIVKHYMCMYSVLCGNCSRIFFFHLVHRENSCQASTIGNFNVSHLDPFQGRCSALSAIVSYLIFVGNCSTSADPQ